MPLQGLVSARDPIPDEPVQQEIQQGKYDCRNDCCPESIDYEIIPDQALCDHQGDCVDHKQKQS